MPLSGEHDRPLLLVCGEDRFLLWCVRAIGAVSVLLLLMGGLSPESKLALTVAITGFLRTLRRPQKGGNPSLLIRPDGACERSGRHGLVDPSAWLSSRYALITLREQDRRQSVVISASRQHPDDYRKLLAWLRLGRWHREKR